MREGFITFRLITPVHRHNGVYGNFFVSALILDQQPIKPLFDVTRPGGELTTYRVRGGHANH